MQESGKEATPSTASESFPSFSLVYSDLFTVERACQLQRQLPKHKLFVSRNDYS